MESESRAERPERWMAAAAEMEARADLRPEDSGASTEGMGGGDLVASLKLQIDSLRGRVEKLEMENGRLSAQLAVCSCPKIEDGNFRDFATSEQNGKCPSADARSVRNVCLNNEFEPATSSLNEEKPGKYNKKKPRDTISGTDLKIAHHAKRYIALKVMYFGQRFYGFASEAQMDPTIESELFKAFKRTKLLVCRKEELCYTRCGRTDKGVSSTGQVISLFLRSNCKVVEGSTDAEGIHATKTHEKEIDYVRVLNKVLPSDIRIIGWCPTPRDFHARFSCLSREYKYLFWKESLNIEAMKLAGEKFIGEHDFRNFCKMDAANVHNYRRIMTYFSISCCDERFNGNELCAMTIKGSAFLWHQVRCMVAVLFMIGQGVESPSIIDTLLDTARTIRKPQYSMAFELPLILQSCEFEGLNFICSSDAKRALCQHFKNEFQTYMLEAAIFYDAWKSIVREGEIEAEVPRKARTHVPLMSRPTEPSYEERRMKRSNKDHNQSPGPPLEIFQS